ncbi:MFS transporter [Nonomuraea sp. NPDC003727]
MIRRWLTLAAFTLSVLLFAVNATVMDAIDEPIAFAYGITPSAAGWAADAYLFALVGVLIPVKARRSVFVSAVAVFGVASIVASFATEATALVGGRAVQGLAAAVAIRAGFVLLVAAFQGARVWPLVVAVSAAIIVGYVGGPVWGGYVAEMFSCRWVFLADVLPAVVVAALFVGAPKADTAGATRPRHAP